MELIYFDKNSQCDDCDKKGVQLVQFSAPSLYGVCQLCTSCLCEAIMLVNPQKFDKEDVVDVLELIVNERLLKGGEAQDNLKSFCKWVQPFLAEGK